MLSKNFFIHKFVLMISGSPDPHRYCSYKNMDICVFSVSINCVKVLHVIAC